MTTGGLFTEEEKGGAEELAFKYAIYRINKDRSLVPNTTFVYDIQYIAKDDSFHAGKRGESASSSLLSRNLLITAYANSTHSDACGKLTFLLPNFRSLNSKHTHTPENMFSHTHAFRILRDVND